MKLVVIRSMLSANLDPSKWNLSKDERTLNHACSHTMLEHEKYIAQSTYDDSQYVLSEFGENLPKDEWTLNHAHAHTCVRGA
jgi:hypothetical protein